MKNTDRKNKSLLIAILSTLVAIGIHAYLSLHFYEVKFGLGTGESFCNINETLNCAAVSASQYSSLLGVPMALWGLVTNIVLLFFLAVTRQNLVQDREKTARYALLLSGVTVLASFIMGIISVSFLSHYCILCITTYALSIIGFAATWIANSQTSISILSNDIKEIFTTERWVLGFLIAIPAFSFLANIMYLESHGLSDIEKMAKERVAYWQVSPQQNFDLTTGLSMQNGTTAPIMTIVEFADFRCSHCKSAAPTLHSFTKNHSDVRLIYKPFPLDGTCNEAIKGGGDGISCGLAVAALCSEKLSQQGWASHDYIFQNQMEITQVHNLDKNLEAIATATNQNLEELKACVNDKDMQEAVRKMAKEGENAQIQGTPTIFVNGKLLNGGHFIPVLDAVYRSLK